MASEHGFCSMHRIAYNRSLDATCPQCILGRIAPPEQLDWDPGEKLPVRAGKLLDAVSLQPVGKAS